MLDLVTAYAKTKTQINCAVTGGGEPPLCRTWSETGQIVGFVMRRFQRSYSPIHIQWCEMLISFQQSFNIQSEIGFKLSIKYFINFYDPWEILMYQNNSLENYCDSAAAKIAVH